MKIQSRRARASVVPVSQGILKILGHEGRDDAFSEIQKVVLDWIEERVGTPLTAQAREGQAFNLGQIGAQRCEAVTLKNLRYWAARCDDSDKKVAQRTWITEISIASVQDESEGLLGFRLICSSLGENPNIYRTIPKFVRTIAGSLKAYLDGRLVSEEVWRVENQGESNRLINFLKDPKRSADVIVLTTPSTPDVRLYDTERLASFICRQTIGVAHVAVASPAVAKQLTAVLGKEFSVFDQAIRTYRRSFDPMQTEPSAHPLARAETIANWSGKGAGAFAPYLVNQLLWRSVAHLEIDAGLQEELPSFAKVRQHSTREKFESIQNEKITAEQKVVKMQKNYDNLIKQHEENEEIYEALVKDAEKNAQTAENEANSAKSREYSLRQRNQYLETQLQQYVTERTVHIPKVFEHEKFRSWCDNYLSGKVEIHKRAYKAVKNNDYEDPQLIYKSLMLLADYYVPMRRDGGREKKAKYEAELAKLKLFEEKSISDSQRGRWSSEYEVPHRGQTRVLDRHLKKGVGREPRHCFRLYFFWDDEHQQVVVGYLPAHLTTRAT